MALADISAEIGWDLMGVSRSHPEVVKNACSELSVLVDRVDNLGKYLQQSEGPVPSIIGGGASLKRFLAKHRQDDLCHLSDEIAGCVSMLRPVLAVCDNSPDSLPDSVIEELKVAVASLTSVLSSANL